MFSAFLISCILQIVILLTGILLKSVQFYWLSFHGVSYCCTSFCWVSFSVVSFCHLTKCHSAECYSTIIINICCKCHEMWSFKILVEISFRHFYKIESLLISSFLAILILNSHYFFNFKAFNVHILKWWWPLCTWIASCIISKVWQRNGLA